MSARGAAGPASFAGGAGRTGLELALAAGLALAAHRWLPVPADDPFRSTLVALAPVIAGLRWVERRALAGGGRRRPAAAAEAEAVVLVLLVLLVLGRRGLGLAVTDPFLAAGLALLLGHRLARLLPVLRGTLGRRLGARPPAVFFLLPFVAYLAVAPWMHGQRPFDGDEPYYLLLTHSLAYDLDVDLGNNYAGEHWRAFLDRPIEPQPGDPTGPEGEVLSRHGPLLPLVLAPAYRLAGAWGALATMAALAALLAWMVLRLAARLHPSRPGAAMLAWAVFAFSAPVVVYSYQVWVEVPAALLLAFAEDRRLALARGAWRWRRGWGLALPLVLLPLVKLRFGLLAIPMLVLAGWRAAGSGRRRIALLSAVFAVVLGSLMAYNLARFGNPLKIHSWAELGIFGHPLAAFVRGGVGMLYDSSFGLFPSAPIWLLLLPAAGGLLLRQRRHLGDLLFLSLPYLLVVAPRVEWFGGWSPPFRYALVLLPLWAPTLVPLLARRHRGGMSSAASALGFATAVLTVVWVVMPGWTYNLATGGHHLLELASDRLGADVTRLFPSTVRPRPATWLWGAASLLLVPLVLLPRRRWHGARLSGVVALLLVAAALPLLGRSLPTRVVHPEDGHVARERGNLHPRPWTLERARYRGGWVLVSKGSISAPIVAGGERVRLGLDVYFLRQDDPTFELTVRAGETPLTTTTVGEAGRWLQLELGPFEWPAGAPLVLEGPEPRGPFRSNNGLIVDRVELTWR